MFTEKAQSIIDLAKDFAFANSRDELDIDALLAAMGSDAEAGVRLAHCLTNDDAAALRGRCPQLGQPAPCPGMLNLTQGLREIIMQAKNLASGNGVPDSVHPGLIDIRHLVCAIACSVDACKHLGGLSPISPEEAIGILTSWYDMSQTAVTISDLVSRLRGLRSELFSRIYGQDHAIQTFVEGLYSAELTAAADSERKRPSAVFVFAGPPGVGKTYMAETCASYLGRPFKRFDMTGYSDNWAHNQLTGFEPSYKGAQPGILTGFVEKNPDSILLFDEIEKAHLNTIQLFYQILDAGRLEDKFTETSVSFRNTVIIFTTNAGKSLYDSPNKIGISAANSAYHKRTILSALENEKNPTTALPAFPPAICSRLAQGYPVMFNHLGINELKRVCAAELARNEALLEKQYFKQVSHDPSLPLCLVLREGGRVDARQLRSEAEKFIKTELFKYFSLYRQERLEDTFEDVDKIHFEVNTGSRRLGPEIRALFDPPEKPAVLLIANSKFTSLCKEKIPEVNWLSASSAAEAIDVLSSRDVEIVLLDIWIRREGNNATEGALPASRKSSVSGSWTDIDRDLDFVPLSAAALDDGRAILRALHQRVPQVPVYLLSFVQPPSCASQSDTLQASSLSSVLDSRMDGRDEDIGEIKRRPIDDELFLACVRAGGARGLVATAFTDCRTQIWRAMRDQFADSLLEICRRLFRENKARSLARERKVLSFDTAVEFNREQRTVVIRLRDFALTRAVDANDAGEMVDDVERPTTSFEDVLGAKSAKESLQFIVDWLKNPKRYSAIGVRPPRGVLLGGPPGTGKTMLARAVAGESDCAFIEKSASSFVTVWQGSGPQNVRDLFNRARRYAPAIIFIDEIDAIGTMRSASSGTGRAQEETLNAILTEMDGFRSDGNSPVIVLAATNLADRLDDALKRRFDRMIEVDKPDKASRLEYLRRSTLEKRKSDVTPTTLERLAGQTAGMTIADLERFVHEAAIRAARNGSVLTDFLLEDAFETFRMGEAGGMPDRSTLERVARHEAGHALIAWLGGKPPVQVTIVGRGNAGGYMESELDEKKIVSSRAELEQDICIAMGGRAAEIVCYGEEEGLSTGVRGDLKHATSKARSMVCDYGMTEEIGQVAVPGDSSSALPGELSLRVSEAINRIVKKQLERGISILMENRVHLDRLSAELLEKNRLTREDMVRFLPRI